MTELAIPNILLLRFLNIIAIDIVLRAIRAEQIPAESAVMSPPKERNELFRTTIAFLTLTIQYPLLGRTHLLF
jgi:hypothetical protein